MTAAKVFFRSKPTSTSTSSGIRDLSLGPEFLKKLESLLNHSEVKEKLAALGLQFLLCACSSDGIETNFSRRELNYRKIDFKFAEPKGNIETHLSEALPVDQVGLFVLNGFCDHFKKEVKLVFEKYLRDLHQCRLDEDSLNKFLQYFLKNFFSKISSQSRKLAVFSIVNGSLSVVSRGIFSILSTFFIFEQPTTTFLNLSGQFIGAVNWEKPSVVKFHNNGKGFDSEQHGKLLIKELAIKLAYMTECNVADRINEVVVSACARSKDYFLLSLLLSLSFAWVNLRVYDYFADYFADFFASSFIAFQLTLTFSIFFICVYSSPLGCLRPNCFSSAEYKESVYASVLLFFNNKLDGLELVQKNEPAKKKSVTKTGKINPTCKSQFFEQKSPAVSVEYPHPNRDQSETEQFPRKKVKTRGQANPSPSEKPLLSKIQRHEELVVPYGKRKITLTVLNYLIFVVQTKLPEELTEKLYPVFLWTELNSLKVYIGENKTLVLLNSDDYENSLFRKMSRGHYVGVSGNNTQRGYQKVTTEEARGEEFNYQSSRPNPKFFKFKSEGKYRYLFERTGAYTTENTNKEIDVYEMVKKGGH